MKTHSDGIDFLNPEIQVRWDLKEDDFVRVLNLNKAESRFYVFEAKLSPINIAVFNRISFRDSGFKLEIFVSQTKVEIANNEKAFYIDPNNTNFLKDYVKEKFGLPKLFSRIFSAINKPFYSYIWSYPGLKIRHQYQDSVGGFFESLIVDVKYKK